MIERNRRTIVLLRYIKEKNLKQKISQSLNEARFCENIRGFAAYKNAFITYEDMQNFFADLFNWRETSFGYEFWFKEHYKIMSYTKKIYKITK